MIGRLSLGVMGTLVCAAALAVFSGCGGSSAPARRPQPPPPAPKAPAPAPAPVPAPAPAPAPGLSTTDPVLARLGLSADQAKKIDALADEYAKKREAMPRDAKSEDRKALADERTAKIREALSAEQGTKYDAGLKAVADYDAKVQKLQQETSAAMMSTPTDQLEKRREVTKTYREKRGVLDAELTRTLDELIGKRPEPPK